MDAQTEPPTIEMPTHYRWIEVTNPTPAILRTCPIPLKNILAVHAEIKARDGRDYRLIHCNLPADDPRIIIETEQDFNRESFLAVQKIIANSTGGKPYGNITEKPYHRSTILLESPHTLANIADAFGRYASNFAEAKFTRFFGCTIPKGLGDKAKQMWNGRVSLREPYVLST